jgi:hypothetical protein
MKEKENVVSDTLKLVDINREQGIRTELHQEDGKTIFKKTYDAEPFLEQAAELRAQTRGERWGDVGRHVGFIPMAELATMMRRDGSFDKKEVRKWLQKNPAFVTFEKYLKR